MKKISIIIPCYNVEQYIDRCMKSLISQTIGIDQLELILVNDASPDNTLNKLIEYEKQYPDSILVINLEQNIKQGGARNVGLKYASCDYVGFVDSDDWVEPTMYEKLYDKMIEHDCDYVTCYTKRVSGSSPMGRTGKDDMVKVIQSIEDRKQLMLDGGTGGLPTRLIKRSLIHDNNIMFPENLAYEDNYWGAMLDLYVNKYCVIEEYLYNYFINPNSTTLAKDALHHYDRMVIEVMKLEEYKARGVFEQFFPEIEYKFIILFYVNTVYMFLTRFTEIPFDALSLLQETLHEQFPYYASNPYIEAYCNPVEKAFVQTANLQLLPEDWVLIKESCQS